MDWSNYGFWGDVVNITNWAIRLLMLVIVPFRRSPEAAKGWLLFIFLLPIPGLLLYLLIGRIDVSEERVNRYQEVSDKFKEHFQTLRAEPYPAEELSESKRRVAELVTGLGGSPVVAGSSMDFLPDYEQAIDRLAEDIRKANRYVHLLYYIFFVDDIGEKVLAALSDACKKGVKCRVIYDSLGSIEYSSELESRLQEIGVEFQVALPISKMRWHSARLDLRNHRKVTVIDGCVAYTGSQNLMRGDEVHAQGTQDLTVRINGPAAAAIHHIFLLDWWLESKQFLDDHEYFQLCEARGGAVLQSLGTGPESSVSHGMLLVLTLIHAAKKELTLVTPYFIPEEALQLAMIALVKQGVKVRLIMSQYCDLKMVKLAQKSYYEELLESGIEICLYQEKFLHAKVILVDDQMAMIGSTNVDIRSFALNAESNLIMYDRTSVANLRHFVNGLLEHCHPLSLDEWRQRSFFKRFIEHLARLFSPLL